MSTSTYLAIGLIGFLIMLFIILYNSLVQKNNNVKEAWSGISVQLKRRYDLIPNIIEAVKGYMNHEKEVFLAVTEARAEAINGGKNLKSLAESENKISSSLKTLFAVSENYPELKANTNFLHLQEELSDTESKIQASRTFYNHAVRSLNIAIETIPSNIIAKIAGFEKRDYFEINEAEKENIKVTIK